MGTHLDERLATAIEFGMKSTGAGGGGDPSPPICRTLHRRKKLGERIEPLYERR